MFLQRVFSPSSHHSNATVHELSQCSNLIPRRNPIIRSDVNQRCDVNKPRRHVHGWDYGKIWFTVETTRSCAGVEILRIAETIYAAVNILSRKTFVRTSNLMLQCPEVI